LRKILLVGNPNVGKSALFSRLTGVHVIASNYPGTTVEFTKGTLKTKDEKFEVIDVPGIYTLNPTNPAEKVAVKMLEEGDIVINIIDATSLERNLNLTLQLLKTKKPMMVVLNMWDETKHMGIEIDVEKLEKILGVSVVPTCAVSGEGIKNLYRRITESKISPFDYEESKKWDRIGEIITSVQKLSHRHHTILERIEEISIKPETGIFVAAVVMLLSFGVIRFIGEGLIGFVFEPFFVKIWTPVVMKISGMLSSVPILRDILIGNLIDGKIDYVESLGLLTTGLFVPFAMVLPYVFSFYLVLSFLEDLGYLPRFGILLDAFMHKLGLHGLAIIPMLLGLGCNVPGALATRILETKRERFIAATLMAIAVPCMAQIAMVFGLIGKYGIKGFALVFGTLFFVWVALGYIQNFFIKGESPEIFIEIPPYRIPYFSSLFKKVWMRVRGFLSEAVPFVILGVLIVNIFYSLGVISFLGKIFAPFVKGIFGLPQSAVSALIIGFLRKDVAVGMLAPLNLTMKQMVIASVVLTMYFPCVATFTVLMKKLGVKGMLKSAFIMIVSTLIVGGLLNLIL